MDMYILLKFKLNHERKINPSEEFQNYFRVPSSLTQTIHFIPPSHRNQIINFCFRYEIKPSAGIIEMSQ